MKHKKMTCFTSLALAVLLAIGSVTGTAVSVLAENDKDGTDIEVSTESSSESSSVQVDDNGIVVESTESGITVETEGSTESESDDLVMDEVEKSVSIGVPDNGEDIVVEQVYEAGQKQPAAVKAENLSDTEQSLVISLWSDADATKAVADGFADVTDGKITVTAKDDTKLEGVVSENTVSFTLAAGQAVEFELNILQESAGSVFAQAKLGEEVTESAEFVWTEKSDDVVIETEEGTEAEEDVSDIVIETTEPDDGFTSIYLGDAQQAEANALNASDFASMRLVMQVEDKSMIPNESDIIGVYGDLYLLRFTSIQQTMNAYVYFKDLGIAVEPDATVEIAGDDADTEIIVQDSDIPMNDEANPMLNVGAVEDSVAKGEDKVIALIDTGTQEHANVIDRVSVIDDSLEGNGHGDVMLESIVSQNPDAKVLSIRAMDDNGFGTISSLVAAMEYAMEQKVDIINLSLYSRTTLSTSVLKNEIQKAVEMGITVIGAAGNDGADVSGYVPGSVTEAWIIGAANADGSRLDTSNFGETVDYNVVAESTSEATALFTGFVSANGLEGVESVLNQGLIYENLFEPTEKPEEPDVNEGTEVNFVDGIPLTLNIDDDAFITVTNNSTKEYHIYDTTKDGSQILIPMDVEVHISVTLQSVDKTIVDTYVRNKDDSLVVNADVHDNVRNAFLNVDSQIGLSLVVTSTESKDKKEVPIFDEVSGKVYWEGVLCGENCLVEHVRTGIPCFKNPGPYLQVASPSTYSWGQIDFGDKKPYSGMVIANAGRCDFKFMGSDPDRIGPCTMTFTSGILSGYVIDNFHCNRPGAANPGTDAWWGMGKVGYYEITVELVDESTGTVSLTIRCIPDDYNSGFQDEIKENVEFTYQPSKGGLSIEKSFSDAGLVSDNSDYSLAGAVYGIYSDYSCTNLVMDLITNASGHAATADDALAAGNYWVKEKTPSKGCALDTKVYPVTVAGGSSASSNIVRSEEPIKTGDGSLVKKSDNPDMTDGNGCYSLAGAVYGVYTNSSCTGQPYKTMTTDASGNASVGDLPFGSYWVKEIQASQGFELDTNVYPITITESNPSAKITSIEPAGNDPLGISIKKIWNGDSTGTVPSLEGTQFTVQYFDNMNKDTSGTPTRTWVIEVKWSEMNQCYMTMLDDQWLVSDSDPFYRHPATNAVILPYGTYKIWESKAAPNYLISGTFQNKDGSMIMDIKNPYVTVFDGKNGAVSLQGGNEYIGYDESVDMSITVKKLDANDKPLAGVTFKIVSESGYAEKQPGWQSEKTTGADGIVKWENVYLDHYTITEIRTVDNHNLLKDPIEIDMPGRMTQADANKYHLVDPNPNDNTDGVVWDPNENVFYINDPVFEVGNDIQLRIPMTGGFTDITTFLPLMGGVGAMGLGAYGLTRKRKKRK